ncbi:hypothetical protein GCM10009872_33750 [Actinopolymorpha rutila]
MTTWTTHRPTFAARPVVVVTGDAVPVRLVPRWETDSDIGCGPSVRVMGLVTRPVVDLALGSIPRQTPSGPAGLGVGSAYDERSDREPRDRLS